MTISKKIFAFSEMQKKISSVCSCIIYNNLILLNGVISLRQLNVEQKFYILIQLFIVLRTAVSVVHASRRVSSWLVYFESWRVAMQGYIFTQLANSSFWKGSDWQ